MVVSGFYSFLGMMTCAICMILFAFHFEMQQFHNFLDNVLINGIVIALCINPYNVLFLIISHCLRISEFVLNSKVGIYMESILYYFLICKLDDNSNLNGIICCALPAIIIGLAFIIIKSLNYNNALDKTINFDTFFKVIEPKTKYFFTKHTDILFGVLLPCIPIIIQIIVCFIP